MLLAQKRIFLIPTLLILVYINNQIPRETTEKHEKEVALETVPLRSFNSILMDSSKYIFFGSQNLGFACFSSNHSGTKVPSK